MSVESKKLQCNWLKWEAVNRWTLILEVPPGNGPDMAGAINMAKAIMEDVKTVVVSCRGQVETVYRWSSSYGKWTCFDARAIMEDIKETLRGEDGPDAPYSKAVVEAFRTMQHAIHENAIEHGWWDEPREDGTALALIHAEVSECLEALREGNPPDKQCPGFSQAEIELADVVIRIMDFCERKGWSLGKAIVAKHEFNKGRPFMHGGKEF